MLILRVFGKSKQRYTGKILISAIAMGIISFVVFGNTYEPKTLQEQQMNVDENKQPSSEQKETIIAAAEPSEIEKPEEEDENNDIETVVDYKSEVEVHPPTSDEEPPASETPAISDHETMLKELKEKITSNVKKAANGKFDPDKTASVIFDPFTGAVSIETRAADNFTNSWIRDGIASDIADTLQAIKLDEKGFDYETDGKSTPVYGVEKIIFVITFPLVDKYGNESEGTVVSATYTKETLEAIVWKNKYSIDFTEIADKYWVSPALEE